MARGGHARSGPPPDPNAVRRHKDRGEWTSLPVAGRDGPVPAWPLAEPTEAEIELWAREWRRPQALMWERNGQHMELAFYVRSALRAAVPDSSAADRSVVQRMMTDLGITVPGMRSNRWKIDDEAPVANAAASTPRRRAAGTVRDRLKVVDGEA